MRLGAIRNFDTLVAFLNKLPTPPQPDAYLAAIARLHFKRDKPYPIIVDLDGYGRVEIEATHVEEGEPSE